MGQRQGVLPTGCMFLLSYIAQYQAHLAPVRRQLQIIFIQMQDRSNLRLIELSMKQNPELPLEGLLSSESGSSEQKNFQQ